MPVEDGWTVVTTGSELDHLLDIFGGFHDALVKEVHILNGGWVQEKDLAMYEDGISTRVLFQRQFRNPSALEVVFRGLETMHLEEGVILDGKSGSSKSIDGGPLLVLDLGTAAFAFRELQYRDASDWMGGAARLGPDWR